MLHVAALMWPATAYASGPISGVRQVADCPISSLRLQETGAIAAVGCADGATTLLRLCDGLVDAQPAEKQTLAAVSPIHPLLMVLCSAWPIKHPMQSHSQAPVICHTC